MKAGMKKLLVAVVLSVSFVGGASADMAKRIDAIVNQASQKKVEFSIHIVKADSGETVYSHNANKALVPASNMKIIVTAAALKYLGTNYEYETKVGLCGDTLVVVGGGDPLLGDRVTDAKYGRGVGWVFMDIAAALKRNGITAIRDIIVDSSIFDDQRVHPNWPKKELNRRYACEVSGLNFNGNCIEISAKTVGGKVAVFIEPRTNYVKVANKVVPISKGKSTVGSYRNLGGNKIVVHGKCNGRVGPFAVAIERPAGFFGFLLAEHLSQAGIAVDGQFIEKRINPAIEVRELVTYKTALSDVLARCNKDSFGLAAEALVKTIAANGNVDKKNGSWAGGREVICKYLAALGIEKKEFYIDDGSGLSRQNKLSANAITQVLLDIYKGENWQVYKDSLAAGGVDGTIGRYFKGEKYKGKVFGKTGYIDRVKSFSGVCSRDPALREPSRDPALREPSGRGGDYIFSILANNANGRTRTAINNIAKAIVDGEP